MTNAASVPSLKEVRTHQDDRGYLGIVEALPDCGFLFKRFYFLYQNNGQVVRGSHAHKELWQYMIALHGSFDIALTGKGTDYHFTLDSPQQGLLIPPGYWRELTNFSTDAVCLVAASEEYDGADYIRDYDEFLRWEKGYG